MKFRYLRAEEIDVKVGSVNEKYYTLLLYKNARVDMAILDETVGAENWQRDHKEVKGNLYCGIGINQPLISHTQDGAPCVVDRWIWKWDCGVESQFGDKEKGEASDSFKRAGVNWGIGRELYTSPKIKVWATSIYDDKKGVYKLNNDEKYRQFKVDSIDYNEKGEIINLTIVDTNGVVVFSTENKAKSQTKQKVEIKGGDYVLQSGKHKDKTIKQVYEEDKQYLEFVYTSDKVSQEIKDNIKAFMSTKGEE